jgi:site-specific recombinase XerD
MAALATPIETVPAIIVTESEIAANLRHHAAAAHGAFASNTERALRADVAIFTSWCSQAGRQALPAAADTLAAFIDAMAASKAPATVRRYVSSVATFHRAAKVANPCAAEAVKLALKRMHRERGRAQQQAGPLTDRLVGRLLAARGTRLRDLRHKAMLVVAYTTMVRRSELVALQFADLQVEADGFGTVVIRRGKTDQEGHGAVAPITADAMRYLQAWIDAAGLKGGSLFRSVLKGNRVGGALDPGDVARFFKAMARRAGLSAEETARISGHSTRIGSAQDMLRYGEQLPAIMQAGRWKTAEMVGRYTAKQGVRQSAAVRIADRRVQF